MIFRSLHCRKHQAGTRGTAETPGTSGTGSFPVPAVPVLVFSGAQASRYKAIARSVCAVLFLLGSVELAIAGQDAPGVIYMMAGPRVDPVWVSAEEATDSQKGGIRWELFSESDENSLRRFVAENKRRQERQKSCEAPESGLDCPIFLATLDEERIDPKPNRSFGDLAKQSIAIYGGRIEGISQGFFEGLPSSLLRVKVTEVFRSSDLVARTEVLIPYQFARFKIGESTFCGGSTDRYQPAAGDRVLVFIYDAPLDADRSLVYPRSPEIFFQTAAGRLIIPELLKSDRDIAVAGDLQNLGKLLLRKVK